MFEKASRMKVRFNHKGLCTVEDLWDLPVRSLDQIFKELNAQLREEREESLLNVKTPQDEILDLKVEIIKYIVKTKLDEIKERENREAQAAKKQKILKIISEKKDRELYDMPVEELEKMAKGS